MTKRLSPEREQEIRDQIQEDGQYVSELPPGMQGDYFSKKELLAEIDELRADVSHYKAVWDDAHVMISDVEKERDQLKAENEHLERALAGRRDEHDKHLDDKMKLKDERDKLRADTMNARLGVTQQAYDNVVKERDTIRGDYELLRGENEKLTDELVRAPSTKDYSYLSKRFDEVREERDDLQSKLGMSMGIGTGSGNLFVHGSYDSIKAAQAQVLERMQLLDENGQLTRELKDANVELEYRRKTVTSLSSMCQQLNQELTTANLALDEARERLEVLSPGGSSK